VAITTGEWADCTPPYKESYKNRLIAVSSKRERALFASGSGVYDFPAQESQFAADVFDVVGGHGVQIAVPYSDIGVFAGFKGADAVFQEQLARGPDRVGLQSCVDVNGFRSAEGPLAVCAF
jgi:hypothetical protein